MPDPELLPPPPAKNKQIEDELLPPPPKKKGKGDSNNGATTLEAGSSVTPNPETEIPIVSLEPENSNSKLPDNTKNPIDLVADYGKLSTATKDVGVTGETQETLPDEGKTVNVDGHFFKVGGRKQAEDLKSFLKDTHGIDADALYNETKDFPKEAYDWKMTDEIGNEVQPYSKENLIKLRQENPTAYYDKINGVKTQYEIAKKTGSWNLANEFINLKRSAQNVDEFVDNVHKQKEIIGKVFDSFDEVQSANERLKSEAYTISPATKGFPESYKSSGLSEKLSPYEYAGLLTLKAFEPEKYKQAIDFINTPIKDVYHHQMPSSVTNNMQAPVAMSTSFDSPEKTIGGKAGSLSQGTIDQKIGLENRMMELSEIGKSNYFQSIQKNNKELDEQINKLDDNDINKSLLINQYNSNVNDLNKAISEGENDNARYPLSTTLKFDRQVADMTQKDPGLLNTAAIKFALQTDKPRKAFENIFGDSPALQMQRLGEEESISQFTYLPEEYRRQNSPIIPVYPKELESAVKQISTDKDLSYEQKQSKIKDLLTANQSKIKIITNPNEGKSKNFFSKATAYTMADFFGNIGGMAFTMAGLPIKGIPKEVIGMGLLFHNDHFTEAVRKGYSNPNEYAALHSGIDMLAATFGTQYQAVKKMISGNPTAKNVLSEVTEDVWNKAVSKDRDIIGKLGGAIKSSLAENGKMVAMWGGAVPALHNVANNTFGKENKSTADILDESFKSMKEMAIGQLPLALAGAYTGYKRESTLRKSLLWDIGDNAHIELQRTKDLEATGKLTPEKAAQRTQTIKEVSRLVDLVPSTDKKGKPLTDDARIDYLYNLYIKNKAKTESGLPDKQKSEAEKTAMVADHLNNDILSSQTDIQLENRKKQIQKKLEEKDDEGKLVIKDKEKAELEAEKEAIELIAEERRNKPDTKLSEPIEGLDENGVPIPKGEPENIEPAAEGEEKVTGVKKAITDETRAANGMPKVEFAKMNSDIDALQEAKERVDSGKVNPQEMVNRILTEKGNYKNEGEVMDMQYYAHQLGKRSKELNQQLAEAKTPEQEADIRSQKLQLSDLMDAQTEAARTAGNQWGKTGNRMQPVINDAGDIFRNNKSDVVDAYGGEVPADVKVKLDAITKERDDAIAAKEKVEEQLRQKMAEKGFEKVKEQASKTKKRNEQKEALQKEAQDLINQLKEEIKGKPDDVVKQGLPITDKMVAIVGKLAVNYVKQGAVGLEALIDKVYESVKDHGISRSAVKSIIGNYEPVEVEREVNRLNKKAEILEEKLTPPTIKTKGNKFAPSEKVDLAKPSKEAKVFRTNNEWVKANQRVANAEFKMKIEKRKAFESQKNWYQRGLAWAGRLTRLSVLSGYNVLGKLAAAATIGAAGKRIPEQAIGAVYSTVFKGIAEKAPIEGFLNAKSEAKWYKEFFNPKKFAKNSMDILKTGSTDLGRRLGSAEYEHVPLLYLPTDLHQIIKDPVKRATFEASFRNGMIWAEKNGLDINDPLVINSLENAAYKRAQYEIFQEQNWLSKKFTSYKSSLEKAGNTGATAKFLVDFMIPVSTVPANIVRRVTTTSPLGLIRGGKEVVDAYRKGIEKLTPDEADHVMKQLKQGTLGTALWMVGWFGYQSFGGLYSQFNPNKKREEGDKVSDVMVINDTEVPKPAQHALPLEVIQMAATARRIFENYKENKNAETPKALAMAGLGAIGAGLEQIPVIETPIHAIMATKDPVEAEKLTEDIGRRFKPQILRETGVIGKKEATRATEFLDGKGLKIVDPHKQNLHPVDKDGNKVKITDEVFDNFKAKREEKIQAEINALLDKGKLLYVNEEGKLIDKKVEDATEKEIQGWLMNKSTKATKDATEEIFGRQPEKQSKEYF